MSAYDDSLRAANLRVYGLIAASAAGALGIAAIANAITRTFETLPASTTAGLVTALPVTLTAMCGFGAMGAVGAAAFIVAWRTPRATQRPRDDEPAHVIASMRAPQIAQQPIRQLPPPIANTEPRYAAWRGDIVNAVQREQQRAQHAEHVPQMAQDDEYTAFTTEYEPAPQHVDNVPQTPSYEPTAPINERITARLGDGQEISISAAAWLAFASLDKPSRDAWRQQLTATGASAPNSDYSKCKQIAEQYHLLSGAGAWISPKVRDNVTQWLTQP